MTNKNQIVKEVDLRRIATDIEKQEKGSTPHTRTVSGHYVNLRDIDYRLFEA